MEVICLEEKAFYELIEQVVERLSEKMNVPTGNWIDGEEAMELLKVKSTTLQTYRDTGKIRFSKPSPGIILYDKSSIEEYIESKAKDTF